MKAPKVSDKTNKTSDKVSKVIDKTPQNTEKPSTSKTSSRSKGGKIKPKDSTCGKNPTPKEQTKGTREDETNRGESTRDTTNRVTKEPAGGESTPQNLL